VHALFNYTDSKGARRTAYRGETVQLGKVDIERGEAHGAFGRPEDVLPGGPPLERTTDAPAAPKLVDRAALTEVIVRERLGVPADADTATVLAALDAALASPPPEPERPVVAQAVDSGQADEPDQPAPPVVETDADGDHVPVDELGAGTVDGDQVPVDEPGEQDDETPVDGGVAGRPLQAARRDLWVAFAVASGIPEEQAAKASKAWLMANTPGAPG
jgi:hypothetical protein